MLMFMFISLSIDNISRDIIVFKEHFFGIIYNCIVGGFALLKHRLAIFYSSYRA